MNPTPHAVDLAETSPQGSLGALRLAAAVGFVLLSTAFTVHSFVVSTEPWQPTGAVEIGADADQEAPCEWDASGSVPIELSLVMPACFDGSLDLPTSESERGEG